MGKVAVWLFVAVTLSWSVAQVEVAATGLTRTVLSRSSLKKYDAFKYDIYRAIYLNQILFIALSSFVRFKHQQPDKSKNIFPKRPGALGDHLSVSNIDLNPINDGYGCEDREGSPGLVRNFNSIKYQAA